MIVWFRLLIDCSVAFVLLRAWWVRRNPFGVFWWFCLVRVGDQVSQFVDAIIPIVFACCLYYYYCLFLHYYWFCAACAAIPDIVPLFRSMVMMMIPYSIPIPRNVPCLVFGGVFVAFIVPSQAQLLTFSVVPLLSHVSLSTCLACPCSFLTILLPSLLSPLSPLNSFLSLYNDGQDRLVSTLPDGTFVVRFNLFIYFYLLLLLIVDSLPYICSVGIPHPSPLFLPFLSGVWHSIPFVWEVVLVIVQLFDDDVVCIVFGIVFLWWCFLVQIPIVNSFHSIHCFVVFVVVAMGIIQCFFIPFKSQVGSRVWVVRYIVWWWWWCVRWCYPIAPWPDMLICSHSRAFPHSPVRCSLSLSCPRSGTFRYSVSGLMMVMMGDDKFIRIISSFLIQSILIQDHCPLSIPIPSPFPICCSFPQFHSIDRRWWFWWCACSVYSLFVRIWVLLIIHSIHSFRHCYSIHSIPLLIICCYYSNWYLLTIQLMTLLFIDVAGVVDFLFLLMMVFIPVFIHFVWWWCSRESSSFRRAGLNGGISGIGALAGVGVRAAAKTAGGAQASHRRRHGVA